MAYRIAIVCASGIGDALILHSISHLASQIGWRPVTYSNHLDSLASWMPGYEFAKQPLLENIPHEFSQYDAVFLQHDNSPKSFAIKTLSTPIFTFYGAHLTSKHGPLTELDYVCNRSCNMVENIALAAEKFFGKKSYDNGLRPPPHLIHRRFEKRIAIHPTGSAVGKIWPRTKFLTTFQALKDLGYDPSFTVPISEQPEWNSPHLKTLADLAAFIYESGAFLGNDSGPGHLASCLQIPHLIIGGDGTQMPLWQPGWLTGSLITPPPFWMQFKVLRKIWEKFISPKKVINNFKSSVLQN